jgi:hypothetical protein
MEEEKKDLQENKEVEEKVTDYRDNTAQVLDEINETNKEILKLTKKISNFVFWQKILGVVKILIFLIPLFLAWRLLDGLINDPNTLLDSSVFRNYADLFMDAFSKNIDPSKIDLNSLDVNNIPAEYRELLNK